MNPYETVVAGAQIVGLVLGIILAAALLNLGIHLVIKFLV